MRVSWCLRAHAMTSLTAEPQRTPREEFHHGAHGGARRGKSTPPAVTRSVKDNMATGPHFHTKKEAPVRADGAFSMCTFAPLPFGHLPLSPPLPLSLSPPLFTHASRLAPFALLFPATDTHQDPNRGVAGWSTPGRQTRLVCDTVTVPHPPLRGSGTRVAGRETPRVAMWPRAASL